MQPELDGWVEPFVLRVALEQVIQGVDKPVAIAHAGDGRLFVVEKTGRIVAYQVTETPTFTPIGEYLDIRDRVSSEGERGLLGLAFHPNFASNRYFFVYYTRSGTGGAVGDIVIARYRAATASATSVDANTESILLTIEHSENSTTTAARSRSGPMATCTRRLATAAVAATPSKPARA